MGWSRSGPDSIKVFVAVQMMLGPAGGEGEGGWGELESLLAGGWLGVNEGERVNLAR